MRKRPNESERRANLASFLRKVPPLPAALEDPELDQHEGYEQNGEWVEPWEGHYAPAPPLWLRLADSSRVCHDRLARALALGLGPQCAALRAGRVSADQQPRPAWRHRSLLGLLYGSLTWVREPSEKQEASPGGSVVVFDGRPVRLEELELERCCGLLRTLHEELRRVPSLTYCTPWMEPQFSSEVVKAAAQRRSSGLRVHDFAAPCGFYWSGEGQPHFVEYLLSERCVAEAKARLHAAQRAGWAVGADGGLRGHGLLMLKRWGESEKFLGWLDVLRDESREEADLWAASVEDELETFAAYGGRTVLAGPRRLAALRSGRRPSYVGGLIERALGLRGNHHLDRDMQRQLRAALVEEITCRALLGALEDWNGKMRTRICTVLYLQHPRGLLPVPLEVGARISRFYT